MTGAGCWFCEHYFLTAIIILALIAVFNQINLHITKIKQRKFAAFISKFVILYNKSAHKHKEELFAPLSQLQSNDPDLKKEGKIRILEVGCGTGANLAYFPTGTRLVMLDFNREFEPHLRESLTNHPTLQLERYIECSVEAMSEVEDASVDAVVATLLFCSVPDVARGLQEVRRVLAPGGKFFFLEHVGAKNDSLLSAAQWVLTKSRFWPYLFCGCELTRDTAAAIRSAGFSEVQVQDVEIYSDTHLVFKFVKSQIVGVAVK